jgi:hypothetical protein
VLEPTSKSCPHAQKVEGRKIINFKKKGTEPNNPGIDPQSLAGRGSMPSLSGSVPFLKKLFFWRFGRMGVQEPHFLKLAPTLGSVKCSIPHGNWRFHFFSISHLKKFRVHLDLHIYRWDFCFMKN